MGVFFRFIQYHQVLSDCNQACMLLSTIRFLPLGSELATSELLRGGSFTASVVASVHVCVLRGGESSHP